MIKIFKIFLILTYILILQSCNTVKEGFRSQKKNSTDEFLVEKKSPLVMPPEFSELPTPKISESLESSTSNEIENLVKNSDEKNITETKTNNQGNFEISILEKIKNN